MRCRQRSASCAPSRPLYTVLAVLFALNGARELFALPPDREVSQYVRRSWTVEQGLPHGTVRGMAQTADGYLWLATYEGVVRFNGERFQVFDKLNTPQLPNSSVLTIRRTRDGTLWLGTVAGVVRYRGGRFEHFRDTGIAEGHVNALEEARDGSLWIGAWGGVSRVVAGRAQRLDVALKSNMVNALHPADDGSLWIGTTSGLARHSNGRLQTWTTADGLSSDTIISLLDDGHGGVLAGTATGLNRVTPEGQVSRVPEVPADQITALGRDHDGNLWIGTYSSGLFRMAGGRVSSYGIADGLLNPTVRAVFEDDEGSLWVGSNRGLEQLRTGRFVSWNKRNGLADDFTRAVFQDRDGVIWVGTAHGLNRWAGDRWVAADDPLLATAYILAIAQSRDGTFWFGTPNGLIHLANGRTRMLTSADGLTGNGIRAIHEDSHGSIWLATDSGLDRILPDGRIESFAGRGGLTTDYVVAFAETKDGKFFVATGGGLAEFDGRQFRLHSAPRDLPSNRLFALHAEGDGTLWLATDGDGLIRWRNGWSKVITTRQGLPYDKIVSIVDDQEGSLWFGTARGTFRVARKALNEVADGTSPRIVSSLYGESDGLGSRQCNGSGAPAALRTRDGRIWFATANGVSALTPRGYHAPPVRLRTPIVERVSVDGKPVSPAALRSIAPGTGRIEFDFTGATFIDPERLHFRYRLEGYEDKWSDAGTNHVASYTNLPAGSYRFLLASMLGDQRSPSASLEFVLEPHFYERRWFIGACIAGAVALLLFIHVLRLHLTQKRAQLLENLVEERTRQISQEKERTELARQAAEAAKREAERHEQLAEEALAQAEEANRTKSIFLATTSHELRTPLNAIIGFSDILISRAAPQLDPRHVLFLHNIHSSGEYLLGIINNILDLSKIEAGRMEFQPESVVLGTIVEGIREVMKGVTALRSVNVELDIPADLPPFEADPTQLKQILYNLMSNAVKFSPEHSTITIAARYLRQPQSPLGENAIEIRVVDRGPGIDPKDHQLIFQEFRQAQGPRGKRPEGTGLGLALVRRFVDMHHGTIHLESDAGHGSTFIVILPCRHASSPRDEVFATTSRRAPPAQA